MQIHCKKCKEEYSTGEHNFASQLLQTYCTVECAVQDGMNAEEAETQLKQTVWRCTGCKGFFPHEQLIHRQGDFGYTPLCPTCKEDPKYFCFFSFSERLRMGLVSSEEIANDYWRQ